MKVAVMWFRRDLRLTDNAALYHALRSGYPVLPVFTFDKTILDRLEEKADRRVSFICLALRQMQRVLEQAGSSLTVLHDHPENAFRQLLTEFEIASVYTNHDYEPYAVQRDQAVGNLLAAAGADFHTFKDQVIFDKTEILKDDGTPYTVFTPYAKKWRQKLDAFYMRAYPAEKYAANFLRRTSEPVPSAAAIGFIDTPERFPPADLPDALIRRYDSTRDFPALAAGTSHMGVHLRFGTVSIRALVQRAVDVNAVYLNELIWREFYQMILWHFPRVGKGKSFKPAYDHIPWRNDENEFRRWCEGTTGYPIVDAGMRELNATGYMHNRVRMITASFLAKHLLIDWRWGEAYFARQLLDYDLAANNGGWQWAAGSGCDAAPYFRVFNPSLQTQKFDKDLVYTRKWVPEFEDFSYPKPVVDHAMARKRALEVYGKALQKANAG
ncbi:cryptochrome/photolyase family protein [Sediminibacterium soli]|uniref:cryptochrome/photolyase family protein n=1 Tax=Sediminibacterium soli TaxID=2698829 RepID=UPI001379470E|nr:deoxyribodipyrimidine photo-lyase [Sediminibacterium soli]NCI48005.1 deoxyribodipyrimidine photo-lyase [Sediminibacterium soli]